MFYHDLRRTEIIWLLFRVLPQAFPAWRDTTAKYRSDLLRRWFNLCKENEDDLAEILQIEQGKPIREAKGECAYGSTFLEWFSEECRRINGEVSASVHNLYSTI